MSIYTLKRLVSRLRQISKAGYLVDGSGRLVHRKVCAQVWGRFPRDWVVHHIDFNRQNNDPQNLIAMPRALHDVIHKTMLREQVRFSRETIEGYLKPYKNPYKQPKYVKKTNY